MLLLLFVGISLAACSPCLAAQLRRYYAIGLGDNEDFVATTDICEHPNLHRMIEMCVHVRTRENAPPCDHAKRYPAVPVLTYVRWAHGRCLRSLCWSQNPPHQVHSGKLAFRYFRSKLSLPPAVMHRAPRSFRVCRGLARLRAPGFSVSKRQAVDCSCV